MKSLSIAKLKTGSVVWIAVIAIAAGTDLLSHRDSCAASGPGADEKSGIDGEGFVQQWLVLLPIAFGANESPIDRPTPRLPPIRPTARLAGQTRISPESCPHRAERHRRRP
jgi:hypothetical protein